MNIDEMEAGRTLDALVAKKVMGYECVCDEEPCDCPVHAQGDYDTLLAYSTDIEDAWRIIECLHSVSNMVFWLTYYPTGTYYATFEDFTPATLKREGLWDSSADSAPLAICRSALKFAEHMEGKKDAHDQPLD